MRGLPILKMEEMITVGVEEREKIFRSIQPSTKFNTRLSSASKGNMDEDEDDDEAEDMDEDDGMGVDKSGKVVLFYMELHPKAPIMQTS